VLVVTAHRDDEVTMRLRNMGVGEVLYKPVEPQTLVEAVRQLLP